MRKQHARRVETAVMLRNRVTCPHCWGAFSPDQVLYIAQHPDLLGDPRLGKDQPLRFLPTRFAVDSAAIDARGFACHLVACPNCHLSVPRALLEMPAHFFSIFGAPACGKSYFLAAMTWRLRTVLSKRFRLSLADVDSQANHRLQEYESSLFLNPDPAALVRIEKTETFGSHYDTVLYGDQAVNYPRPFLFELTPLETHPNGEASALLGRALCLYDNAGESFLPGQDTAANPVTRHLAQSRALLFLFDPTQDVRFRQACRGRTEDPQMVERAERLTREHTVRQETILLEAADRVRRYAGLSHRAKHRRPLIVVVTKFDCWTSLLSSSPLPSPWSQASADGYYAMRLDRVEAVSQRLRSLLWEVSPEVVAAAEAFSHEVIYIPVSATGGSPETDPATGVQGFRPKNIQPLWAEVPLLYTMTRWMDGLIPHAKSRSEKPVSAAAGEEAETRP